MTLSVTCPFDGGNIEVAAIEGDRVDLNIRKDNQSDFYQWFYFRVTGAAGRPLELRLLNCAGAAYPHGWENYRACMSADREEWERVDTVYRSGVLTIPGNIAGYPAISMPAGLTNTGMPVGLQAYARRHEDKLLLDLALLFERDRPWPLIAPRAPA